MNMGNIIKDSLRYPFSDWKKIIIFGFILLFSRVTTFFFQFRLYMITSLLIFLIGVLILFFLLGYEFKIIKSTFNGAKELPKLNDWTDMFISGIKIYIVRLVYLRHCQKLGG